MSTPRLRMIASVEPKPGFRLAIVWAGGATSVVDMSPTIAKGGVFGPLEDVALYEMVRVGERRRTIEWPRPLDEMGAPRIDIDADALAAMASPVRTARAREDRRKAVSPAGSAPAKKRG